MPNVLGTITDNPHALKDSLERPEEQPITPKEVRDLKLSKLFRFYSQNINLRLIEGDAPYIFTIGPFESQELISRIRAAYSAVGWSVEVLYLDTCWKLKFY